MNKLPLKVITEVLGGRTERGTDHVIIGDVTTKPKRFSQGTLYFDFIGIDLSILIDTINLHNTLLLPTGPSLLQSYPKISRLSG
jgi:hypothetical protein